MSLHELRYEYKVEGAGKSFETTSMARAYFYLGRLNTETDYAELIVTAVDITDDKALSEAVIAYSIDGVLTELAHTPFTRIPA